MTDLYIAVRSDTSEVVKVGRSDDVYRRCAEVAAGQCFRVRPLAIFPGAGEYEAQAHAKLRPHIGYAGPLSRVVPRLPRRSLRGCVCLHRWGSASPGRASLEHEASQAAPRASGTGQVATTSKPTNSPTRKPLP